MNSDSQGGSAGGGGGNNAGDQQAKARQQAEQQEMMKNSILSQVLDQKALVRLSNLAAAKPDRARMAENTICQMARMGQITGKLSDEQLKQLLDRFAEKTQKTTTVKFDRRRAAIDSDDED